MTAALNFFARHKFLRFLIVIITLGAAYYALMRLTGLSLFCPVNKLTGLACPGCGVTHFFVHILHFEFAEAFRENLAISVLIPVWAVTAAAVGIKNGFSGFYQNRFVKSLAWVSVALLIIFGVVRNLPGCEFLLPSYMR